MQEQPHSSSCLIPPWALTRREKSKSVWSDHFSHAEWRTLSTLVLHTWASTDPLVLPRTPPLISTRHCRLFTGRKTNIVLSLELLRQWVSILDLDPSPIRPIIFSLLYPFTLSEFLGSFQFPGISVRMHLLLLTGILSLPCYQFQGSQMMELDEPFFDFLLLSVFSYSWNPAAYHNL